MTLEMAVMMAALILILMISLVIFVIIVVITEFGHNSDNANYDVGNGKLNYKKNNM